MVLVIVGVQLQMTMGGARERRVNSVRLRQSMF